MTLNKIAAIGLLSTVAMGSALAFSPIMKVNQSGGIHTDIIATPSGKAVNARGKIGLGKWGNGNCTITKTIQSNGTEEFHNGDTMTTEGNLLKQKEGPGISCIQESYTDVANNGTTEVTYQVISDAAGNYVGSNPSISHITLK